MARLKKITTRTRRQRLMTRLGTGGLAVIGAVALALSGCGSPAGRQASTPSSSAPPGGTRSSSGPVKYELAATIPVGKGPGGVAVDPGTHTVYVVNNSDDSVSVIDGGNKTVIATVPVAPGPYSLAVDPGTHTVYAGSSDPHGGAGAVSVIDGSTHAVTATVPVGKYAGEVAVDPGSHIVYATNSGDDTMSLIDGSTHAVTATIPVAHWPKAVAVDPGTHVVYVATIDPETAPHDTQPPSRSGRVSVIDASTRTVTATIPVGKDPDGLAVDPGTHTVYVPKYANDTLAVIDGATRAVTVTAPLVPASLGHGVAVDPGTHTVYVSSFNDGTVSVIEPR